MPKFFKLMGVITTILLLAACAVSPSTTPSCNIAAGALGTICGTIIVEVGSPPTVTATTTVTVPVSATGGGGGALPLVAAKPLGTVPGISINNGW